MAGSVNKVILVGNVGKDPEIRTTQGGDRIANLRLATSESWTDKASGERKERSEWHTVVCFNDGLSGVIERYVKKGSKLYVEGSLQTRKWTDKDNQDRYSTEVVLQKFGGTIVLLGDPSGERREPAPRGDYGSARTRDHGGPKESFPADLDDEIPF